VLNIVIVIFAFYVVMGISLMVMQPKLIYKPTREVSYTPDQIGLDYEPVKLTTSDGVELEGWFVPAKNAEFTVLFCHGNGGNIAHRLDSISIFNELGLSCFIFDYRGYGNSQGRTTEKGTYLDAQAAYQWLTGNKNTRPDKIIVMGRSLGGTIAAYIASKFPVKGLVIESCFTSYVDMGRKYYPYLPISLFAFYRYNTLEYLKQVSVPVMIVHSTEDDIVPFEFGEQLYNSANKPVKFVKVNGTHNDYVEQSIEIYKQAWLEWLDELSTEVLPGDRAVL